MPNDMDNLTTKFLRLKAQVSQAQKEAAEAAGARSQLLETLQRDFGCNGTKEGEELLQRLERKLEKQEQELEEALQAYEEKWHA